MKSVRETFLADEGCVFVRVDLSQIEDRIGKLYCGTERMVEIANRHPSVYDAHTDNARLIFGKDEISKDERYLGKKCVHASVDRRTEFLTERGFVYAPNLTRWDKVAQWDIATKKISFVYPTHRFKYLYTGKMLRFRSKFFSQFVTSDHRMPYESNGRLMWAYADSLPKGAKIPLNGHYVGRFYPKDDFVRLVVAAQADGTVQRNSTIVWHLKKERKISRLMMLLKRLGIEQYRFSEGKKGDVYICIGGELVSDILYWIPNKLFGPRLLDLCARSIDVFLNELGHWDGDFTWAIAYRTSEPCNVEWVQILAHLAGRKASYSITKPTKTSFSDKPSYKVNISTYKYSTIQKPHIEYVKNFPVYCLTVPKSYFMIRRNGCVSITGNSWRKVGGDTMSESVSKDTDGKLFVPPARCQRLIRKFLDRNPEIEDIYFPMVEERMVRAGKLVNSWGRVWNIDGYRIDADLYRRGYSWYLQSEAADWTNQYMFIPTFHHMMRRFGWPPNLQVHDEVAVSVPFDAAWETAMFIVMAAEQRREIPKGSGNWLKVPAGITVSDSWYGGVEFKKMPEKLEFDRQVKEWFNEYRKA